MLNQRVSTRKTFRFSALGAIAAGALVAWTGIVQAAESYTFAGLRWGSSPAQAKRTLAARGFKVSRRITSYNVCYTKLLRDALLAFGNEAEPQFARYLSDYWPSFETCGVLLMQKGDPVLLIGPESYTFASDRSRIPDIRRLASGKVGGMKTDVELVFGRNNSLQRVT